MEGIIELFKQSDRSKQVFIEIKNSRQTPHAGFSHES